MGWALCKFQRVEAATWTNDSQALLFFALPLGLHDVDALFRSTYIT